MPKPYEFANRSELVNRLKESKTETDHHFAQLIQTLEEIVQGAVGRNTVRAFHHMPKPPLATFRRWANDALEDIETQRGILNAGSQEDYDECADALSADLREYWKKNMQSEIAFGPSRKLPNLLLKDFVRWSEIKAGDRDRLLQFLHIPLDSFTLVAIRNFVVRFKIPRSATMRFVDSQDKYDEIQEAIREITEQAGVPPIYFEILAWKLAH